MFEDYYYDNPELQGLLAAAAGAPIMDAPRQAAVMPMTQQAVAPDYLSMLAGLDLSGLGGFGGGRMGGVIQDPNIQYITAPISNKGNPTGKMGGNVFAITPDQPVRLVDLNTKTVIFEGTGPEAARKATEIGQSITDARGRKASYDIQTADPSGAYVTVANEKRNKSFLGEVANVVGTVAPLALGFVPGFGQLSLLAKVAAAAGTGGLGAALKGDDILKGALLGGATAGIATGTGLDKALGSALGGLSKGAVQGATQGVAQGLSDEIVVTALSKALQGAGSAAANALVSNVGKAGLSEITGYKTPAEQYAQQQAPAASNVVNGVDQVTGEIVANARKSFLSPDILASILNTGGLAAGAAGNVGSNVINGVDQDTGEIVAEARKSFIPPDVLTSIMSGIGSNVINGIDQVTGEIVVKAPESVSPPPLIPGFGTTIPAIIPSALNATQTTSTPPSTKDGVLGTGLNIPQLLSIGGIGADLLQSLLAGGGGGAGTGAPYVSPFGGGSAFTPRQDMRVNPNILDYERYGFGPEAMFFRPEYSGLLPANAPAQAPPAMTINPAYMPLI
jgi:hypothetical protein